MALRGDQGRLHGLGEDEEVGVVVKGAGQEGCVTSAGCIYAADGVGGGGDGLEGEPEGLDALGVLAGLEAVEVASRRACAGAGAAVCGGSRVGGRESRHTELLRWVVGA